MSVFLGVMWTNGWRCLKVNLDYGGNDVMLLREDIPGWVGRGLFTKLPLIFFGFLLHHFIRSKLYKPMLVDSGTG